MTFNELVELTGEYTAVDGGRGEDGWYIQLEAETGTVYAHTSQDTFDRFEREHGFGSDEKGGDSGEVEDVAGFSKASSFDTEGGRV